MKLTKTLLIISALSICLNIFAYYNTAVSYRYEVKDGYFGIEYNKDLTEAQKAVATKEVDKRKQELDKDFKTIKKLIAGSIIVTAIMLIIHLYVRRKLRIDGK